MQILHVLVASNKTILFLLWYLILSVSSQHCKPVTILVTQPTSEKAQVTKLGLKVKNEKLLGTSNYANINGALRSIILDTIDLHQAVTNSSITGRCVRRKNYSYISFFQLEFCNPDETSWWFSSLRNPNKTGKFPPLYYNEYGIYLPMDHNVCHDDVYCESLFGSERMPSLGQFVGFMNNSFDKMNPTEGAYSYSLPGECPLRPWKAPAYGVLKNKTEDNCETRNPTGQCPRNRKPNGKDCTWKLTLLGQVVLDDLVGITSMINPSTNKSYEDYDEFCRNGGIEFIRDRKTNDFVQGLPFWEAPLDPIANRQRVMTLVKMYHNTTLYPLNIPLPSPLLLRESNPPCYQTSLACGDGNNSTSLCRRDSSQYCISCTKDDARCVLPPTDWKNERFPAVDFNFALA